MKKLLLSLMFLWPLGNYLKAQASLSPIVISPAGNVFANGAIDLSFTVAEMTIVETYSSGNSVLNQGFQNGYWMPTILTVEAAGSNPLSITVFPNPCNESFSLATNGINDQLSLKLYDPLGKLVINKMISPLVVSELTFPVKDLIPGIYSITLNNIKNNYNKIYTSKISIIH